jgi:hypothetical protein
VTNNHKHSAGEELVAIIFEKELLPPEVMGVDIIENVTKDLPEPVADWLWRLPICMGVRKSCASSVVIECCSSASDFILDHKDEVIKGIREHMPKYQPEDVFGKWLYAFSTMRSIARTRDECRWIAEGKELTPAEKNRLAKKMLAFIDTLRD